MAGHSGLFTPDGYLPAVIHTMLAGIEPTTFRLLVRRPTSRATETTRSMLLLLSLLSLLISFHGSSVHTAALTADRCVGNYYYERLFVFIWLFLSYSGCFGNLQLATAVEARCTWWPRCILRCWVLDFSPSSIHCCACVGVIAWIFISVSLSLLIG